METVSAVPSVSSTRTAVVAASACVETVTTSLPLPGRIASEPVGRVNVKATTNERVGDIGAGLAVAAMAVALLEEDVP